MIVHVIKTVDLRLLQLQKKLPKTEEEILQVCIHILIAHPQINAHG